MTELTHNHREVATIETERARSQWADAWHRLRRHKGAVLGMALIAFFMFVALFAPLLAPNDPLQINDGKGYLPPAWVQDAGTGKSGEPQFLMGTDTIGRDVFSRLIYGARVSMFVGLAPVFIILLVGATIGMISGYAGGRVDNLLMRLTDVVFAFPGLLFFIILVVTLRDTTLGKMFNGLLLLFVALAIVSWVGVARLVRGTVLAVKQQEYVEAARSMGAKDSRIMIRHIFPNILSPIVVWIAFAIPGFIIAEATLGYLGLGLKPATDSGAFFITSWGALMLEGRSALGAQPWILFAPSLCIGLVVIAFTFLGDGLRDALDPRQR